MDEQLSYENLKYKLSDFWFNYHFVITKEDKIFLQKWANTFDANDEVFYIQEEYAGDEIIGKQWYGKMLQNLFNDVKGLLEGKDSSMGTIYTVKPTNDKAGDIKKYFYSYICDYLEDIYEDFSEDLLDLFKKTSFYEAIILENRMEADNGNYLW